MEHADYPKVTPGLLARADTMCPRRLRRDFDDVERGGGTWVRNRVRERVLDAARQVHDVARAPTAAHFPMPLDLIPEEAAVFERAVGGYIELFGSVAAKLVPHDCATATVHHQRQLRIGGYVDLVLVTDDGELRLRQLDVSGRPPADEPLEQPAVRVALLRLARVVGERPVTVELADLIGPAVTRANVRVDAELDQLRSWFDERIAVVEERSANPIAVAGGDCAMCRHVAGCPAHFPARAR